MKPDTPFSDTAALDPLFGKERPTILITDSGLGGLSILAQIAARLNREPLFSKVSLIYFNAWPEQNRGYNGFKEIDERVRVFDGALAGMQRYQPDLIIIACNTLSVLFDRTAFRRREPVPVVDIVKFGVEMIFENLSADSDSAAVLLGTLTTIAANVHRSQLIALGIAPARIISQPCDQLATLIERGPDSAAVSRLLDRYLSSAVELLATPPSRIFAALLCTHFAYCADRIQAKLERFSGRPVTLLDPNQRLAAYLFEAARGPRHLSARVDIRIVSRILWEPAKIAAIAPRIDAICPKTAHALRNYAHQPDLFSY